MTTTWQWKFPPTRTCLWDGASLGTPKELSLARSGRIYVQLSVSALHRALSHARMATLKVMDCFFIGTAWIDNAEIIVVEMNRFDPGRSNRKDRTTVLPTSLMAGDIPVRTQIVLDAHPDARYLSHNLSSFQDTRAELNKNLSRSHCTTLDPSLFISLRLHCACSEEGVMTVQCGCMLPSLAYIATPIRSIPMVQTALARNLSGPLPISALQGKYKHGFLTMDSSRKLILLLHSDPKVPSLPLVGVWVSGVETTQHPIIWAACASYIHSEALSDRVWGQEQKGTFLLLLYLKGSSQAHFMECQSRDRSVPVQEPIPCSISSAETKLQWMPDLKHVELELLPVDKSSALHTLLESVMGSADHRLSSSEVKLDNIPPQPNIPRSYFPERLPSLHSPSQAPERVVRDSNLSVISSLSLENCSSTHFQSPDVSLQEAVGPVQTNTSTSCISETSTMHLDLRSYVGTSSSSGERSKTPTQSQAWRKEGEDSDEVDEKDRASFSHLLEQNEADYYKLLLNEVLGQQEVGKDRNKSDVDSGNWHPPPAHSLASRTSASYGVSSVGQTCGKPAEGEERGKEVAGYNFSIGNSGGLSMAESDYSTCYSLPQHMSTSDGADTPSFNYHQSGSSCYVSPPDLSLLSVPPSGIHTMLLTAGLWGLDLSMDEEFHQADLIGKKYLQGTPSPATAAGESGRRNPGPTHPALDDTSVNQTLALSTTMYQFLERHNIMGRRKFLDVEKTRALQKFT